MRVFMLALAVGLSGLEAIAQTPSAPAPASGGAASAPAPLTLEEAVRLAETANPNVRAREAQLAIGEGLRREASSPFVNNPAVSLEQARRREPAGSTFTERTVGLSQTIETGGQQRRRREVAAATTEALQLEIEDARRQARAEATLRFFGVLGAQRRIQIEERALQLFESSSQIVSRRRQAGEDTRLDANVASIEAERARNALGVARERLLDARAELAAVLQLPPAQLPQVAETGIPPSLQPVPYSFDTLLQAVQNLPRVRALAARLEAARARLALERGRRSPDVTVGLRSGREGPPSDRERVTTLSLSLPVPVFNQNSAAVGQAVAELGQAEVEHTVVVRDSEAQVRRLWQRLVSQRERVQRLQQAMVPASQDNQQLAARSRQAGQIGALDQLVVNRQALDAERELGEALAELEATRIELERSAGWPQQGNSK